MMRVLISSDWQTETHNIPNCELAASKILQICKSRQLQIVVIAGDLKNKYNPVDLRVIAFWMGFVKRLREVVTPILLLGNHDRIGLYQDEHNWLPVLEGAGAQVAHDDWQVFGTGAGSGEIYLLPFSSDEQRWEEMAQFPTCKPNPQKDILIFHQTVIGTQYNKTGVTATKGYALSKIQPQRFRYCIGGDVHLSQKVGENTWYCGSPFPMDRGEVNQKKFFAIVTDKGLEWVPTEMPGWYDPSVKGFKAPESWKGTRIFLRVPVKKGDNYGAKLSEVKLLGEKKYEGASITVIPEVEESLGFAEENTTVNLSEQEQIRKYVTEVWPEDEQDDIEVALSYIDYKLRATNMGLRLDLGVKFRRVWGEHVLSFDSVDLDINRKGLVVIAGVNKDWPGRSNGSGKSNLCNLIPIALFGKTVKGQTHDAWAQEDYDGRSWIKLEWETASNSVVVVERSRNPVEVHLYVNGTEISAGGKSMDVSKEIEKLCGFSYDMFVAMMYVSREEQNFLWGTQKQKQEMLSRLQNLERFAAARKFVGKDISLAVATKSEWNSLLGELQARVETKVQENTPAEEIERLKAKMNEAREELNGIETVNLKLMADASMKAEGAAQAREKEVMRLTFDVGRLNQRIKEVEDLPDKCPTCGQPIARNRTLLLANLREWKEILLNKGLEYATMKVAVAVERKKANELNQKLREAQTLNQRKQYRKDELQRALEAAAEEIVRWEQQRRDRAAELKEMKAAIDLYKLCVQGVEEEIYFLHKVDSILARDGLPAYLSQMICPKINLASAYYSELFAENEIQVRFHMVDGEIETEVINANGSRKLSGQSSGEGGLETLITSFALRAAGARTNFLALDEPGDGLDTANARVFAAGIRKIEGQVGAVFLITHSDALLSELADVPVITVTKENRVSRLGV